MKKILLFLCAFIVISFTPSNAQQVPSKPNFNVHEHRWELLYDDKNALIFVEPDRASFDPDTGNGVFLFRVIFTHPEQNIEKETGKKIMSLVGFLVVDCNQKQYSFVLIQAMYDDRSVENLPTPAIKDIKMKTISDVEIKNPTKYQSMMFSYVYNFFEELKKQKKHRDRYKEHLDKNGKMII